MNQRIQALAEHCDFYVGNEHYNKSHEEKQRLFMEKFAQLIIKECVTVSLKSSHRYDDMGAIIAGNIEEHFGVEE